MTYFAHFCTGLQFENSCEVGVFSKLTNAYCLVAIGGSENFYRYMIEMLHRVLSFLLLFWNVEIVMDIRFNYSTFEAELADVIPVVKTSIAGTRIVGRLCAGLILFSLFCRYTLTSYKSKTSFNHFFLMFFFFSFVCSFFF